MDLTISGRHIEITEPIREYAHKRVSKLPRYYDRVRSVDVVADKSEDHHGFEVEIIAHVDQHDPFVAKSKDDDLYAGIDGAVDKLERQLTDHKEKLRNRKHMA